MWVTTGLVYNPAPPALLRASRAPPTVDGVAGGCALSRPSTPRWPAVPAAEGQRGGGEGGGGPAHTPAAALDAGGGTTGGVGLAVWQST